MSFIPTELITLLGSSVLGSISRLWGYSAKSRYLERLFFLQQSKVIHQARVIDNPGFQWTRRLIAFMSVFSIIVLPKLVAIFWPQVAIHFGYPQSASGIFTLFFDINSVKWVQLSGLVITPLDTHMVAAIIGLYFGGSLISPR